MFDIFSRYLVIKLAIVVLCAVVTGFSLSAMINARYQLEMLEIVHEESASALAQGLVAGVRNAMLTGNGIHVRALLEDAKEGIEKAEIHVYSAEGEEVFGEPAPAPQRADLPEQVRLALDSGEPHDIDGGGRAWPIANEARCTTCHQRGGLRGVLTLGTADAAVTLDATDPGLLALAEVARSGFVRIMTGRHHNDLDRYFEELAKETAGLEGISVFSADAIEMFVGGEVEPDDEDVERAAASADPIYLSGDGGVRTLLVPLPNEPRCTGCHEANAKVRGVLALAFRPDLMDGGDSLHAAALASVRHVMMAGLGRMVKGFLDDVRETGLVTRLTLHDRDGRLYHDAFHRPPPPAHVAKALKEAEHQTMQVGDGLSSRFRFVAPIPNDKRCQSCHGTDRPLRGAIAIELDTSREAIERDALRQRSTLFAAATILLVVLLLYLGLRYTVLRPVRTIGQVADEIGQGRLDARVDVSSRDEIGRLAEHINDMTTGLRQKLELSKFVSRATLRSVHESERVARVGERRHLTVLFSDIRGFTTYSEGREPEEVVEMLNATLQAQADIVLRHGGDIDKFVGDEVMARFDGPGHQARAVRCAVELVARVEAMAAAGGPPVSVGVGVNTGDMILGAMGSAERMDFTVIGDAVNLGARLCSAALAGQVLVSADTREGIEPSEADGLVLVSLAPIRVKGKQETIAIYQADAG